MTITAAHPASHPVAEAPARPRRRWELRERLAVVALLAAAAALYLWNLGASGWANSFYAAAVQAGSQSWTTLLFGSSDAANSITVDKTPAALWVMGISARLFGFNAWSMLVPQALMGVAAVGVLYAAVRRVSGPRAALLSGVVLALTPAAALMFRFNNPDTLLVLSMVVAAYCVLRGLENGSSPAWLAWAGVALGVGFLAKMLQVLLVAPVFALVFLACAELPWRSRLRRLLGAAVALTVSAGWYLVLVALWPADSRPYIGGSQRNSILELALGHNGLGRLTGNETGGLGNMNHDVGWARLLGGEMGGPIGWLLPAALIALTAGLFITGRARRTDGVRAALLLWGGWLVVTAVTFSYMNGIVHPYYTVALAPAVAATLGIGGHLLWARRADIRAATTLAGILLITSVLSFSLLQRNADWLPGFLDASRPGAELTALLSGNATDYVWAAAAVGSNNAAGYQLVTGAPVMAVGGSNGTDPASTLEQFQKDVGAGRIHFFIGGTMMRPHGESTGSDAAQLIAHWVQANFVSQTIGSVAVYDLSE